MPNLGLKVKLITEMVDILDANGIRSPKFKSIFKPASRLLAIFLTGTKGVPPSLFCACYSPQNRYGDVQKKLLDKHDKKTVLNSF